jgi:hypothetical protein
MLDLSKKQRYREKLLRVLFAGNAFKLVLSFKAGASGLSQTGNRSKGCHF